MIKPPEHWQTQRSMSPLQFRKAITELGVTRAAAARFLGVSERTAHRYANGDSDIPPAHALLLRAMLAHDTELAIPKWHKDQN